MQHIAPNPFQNSLWQIYYRPQPAQPWRDGDNLPWDDPEFSERMLREHLDQSHGAASRQQPEILRQVDWLWTHLGLYPGARLLDITCGPGLYAVELAARGVQVTGIDFSPASLRYARQLALERGVAGRCQFIQADVRVALPAQAGAGYDAATFLYGQLAVFSRLQARQLLGAAAAALRSGGRLAIELLDFARIDKSDNTWWFTDDTGLWGDRPFLSLGERRWDAAQRASIDRFHIIDLATGRLQTIGLSDNGWETAEMLALLHECGFSQATTYAAWDGLQLYDAEEWVAYVAER
jgi:SAM-dependent methyltransferase